MTAHPSPGAGSTGPTPSARPDPLIDEVRDIRRRMSEECGNDLDRLVARLRDIEQRMAKRIVRSDGPGRSSRVA